MKISTFSSAVEAQRCLSQLERIERLLILGWREELTELGRRHPDMVTVTGNLADSLHDAWDDSGAARLRRELSDALDAFEYD